MSSVARPAARFQKTHLDTQRAIGIDDLVASGIVQRTRALGIRMALGAARAKAVRTAALPGVTCAGLGVLARLALARGTAGALRAFTWDLSPSDPATFILAAAAVVVVALLASVLPAVRILRLNLVGLLRHD